MSKSATEEMLELLHAELAQKFRAMLKNDEVPASLLKEVREFLKDNKIEAVPRAGTPLGGLCDDLDLPFPDADTPQH